MALHGFWVIGLVCSVTFGLAFTMTWRMGREEPLLLLWGVWREGTETSRSPCPGGCGERDSNPQEPVIDCRYIGGSLATGKERGWNQLDPLRHCRNLWRAIVSGAVRV